MLNIDIQRPIGVELQLVPIPNCQLAGLHRALIITAENDVLRDEGEAYGRRLIEAGVEVVTTRYNATIHDFILVNALATAVPTRAAMMQAVDFLKSVFAPKSMNGFL